MEKRPTILALLSAINAFVMHPFMAFLQEIKIVVKEQREY